jgi:hypothetical protein
MARTGGRFPFDASLAVTGPARVLWAPTTVAVPTDLNDVIQLVADGSGEYPAKTGWVDFGLSADAPSYSHDKDTDALEYEQPSGALFESVSSITRSFSAQVAELDDAALKIIENTALTAAVAASAAAAPAGSKKPAQTKVFTGLYSGFVQYRVAWLFARPVGASQVTEPGPPVVTRPPFVARIFPLVQLAKDSTDVESSKGDPTNVEVQFDVMPDASQGAGKEHGYWVYETPGAIVT